MIVLALAGYKGSGKDTAAEFLTKECWFRRLAFADKLKENVAYAYNINRSSLDDPKLKEAPLLSMPVVSTDRFTRNVLVFMAKEFSATTGEKFDHAVFSATTNQLLGVRAKDGKTTPLYWSPRSLAILEGSTKRSVNPNYWVDYVVDQIKDPEVESNRHIVITDLRYKSEVARLKEVFGDSLVTARVVRNESTSEDPSERDLDDHEFDYYLYNQKDKTYFYSELDNLSKILERSYV
jgi:hypothetical protein